MCSYGMSSADSIKGQSVKTGNALEEMIADCFWKSVSKISDPIRLEKIDKFEHYVRNIHCEESVNFLIAIFKYEYIYDLLYRRGTEKVLLMSSPRLLPYDERRSGRSRSESFHAPSINLEDHDATKAFVSTIDDMGLESLNAMTSNGWKGLRDATLESDESEVESEFEVDTYDEKSLIDQWSHIINNYVKTNAPDQINLSSRVCTILMKENKETGKMHDPVILLKAKNEIMQLVKENVHNFFRKTDVCLCDSMPSSPPPVSDSEPRTESRSQSRNESRGDSGSESRAERGESRNESKNESKNESRSEPRSESRNEPRSESRNEPRSLSRDVSFMSLRNARKSAPQTQSSHHALAPAYPSPQHPQPQHPIINPSKHPKVAGLQGNNVNITARSPSPTNLSPSSFSTLFGHLKIGNSPTSTASSSTNSSLLHHEDKSHRFRLFKRKNQNTE